MQLLDEGLIGSLDDNFGSYHPKYNDALPEEYADTPITFRHLLTHSLGVPHQDSLWSGGTLNLEFRPGTRTMYSTHGFGILGDVMSEITGETYAALVREYIGGPVAADSFEVRHFFFDAPAGQVASTIGLGWYCPNVGTDNAAVYHAGSNGAPRAFLAVRPEREQAVGLTGLNISADGAGDFSSLVISLMALLD